MKYFSSRTRLAAAASAMLVASTLMLGGCASTPPAPQFTKMPSKPQLVAASDKTTVRVDAAQGIEILPSDLTRIQEEVLAKTSLKKMGNTSTEQPHEYEVAVHLTRYEPGNAFARFMLAGLGQIHIDAHVSVVSLPDRVEVSSFDIAKTFAWGGAMGLSTHIQDIEPVFAEGVANALTGASDDKKPSQTASK